MALFLELLHNVMLLLGYYVTTIYTYIIYYIIYNIIMNCAYSINKVINDS